MSKNTVRNSWPWSKFWSKGKFWQHRNCSTKHNYEVLLPEIDIKCSKGPIRVLGVYQYALIMDNLSISIIINLWKKATNLMKIWQKRRLSLYGKLIILNTFIISQFVYLLSVLQTPPDIILEHKEQAIFGFIWNTKPDKIKIMVFKYPKHHGGLEATWKIGLWKYLGYTE